MNTKKTAIDPNYQLDDLHHTTSALSESKTTTPRTSSRTLIVDQNTNLEIEYSKIRSVSKEDVMFKLIRDINQELILDYL